MVEVSDLKAIIMLSYLKDSMLEKLAKVTLIREYSVGDTIFREGDDATHLYSVIEGKVGLEVFKDRSTPVLINTICQNRTFGFSAVVETEEKKYLTTAKAYMRTKLFAWKGEDLTALFQEDCEMGFMFMQRIAKIIKTRLEIRTMQFLDIYG
jgi:CRP-like cAMP-binding protein